MEKKTYTCKKCNKIWEKTYLAPGVSEACAVVHYGDECCHFGERPVEEGKGGTKYT